MYLYLCYKLKKKNNDKSGVVICGYANRKIVSVCRTEMKPLPPFVMWDQNWLQVQVW